MHVRINAKESTGHTYQLVVYFVSLGYNDAKPAELIRLGIHNFQSQMIQSNDHSKHIHIVSTKK